MRQHGLQSHGLRQFHLNWTLDRSAEGIHEGMRGEGELCACRAHHHLWRSRVDGELLHAAFHQGTPQFFGIGIAVAGEGEVYAAVLRHAGIMRVRRERVAFAGAVDVHALRIHTMRCQVAQHGFGPGLRKRLVVVDGTVAVGVAMYGEGIVAADGQGGDEGIEFRGSRRGQGALVLLEMDEEFGVGGGRETVGGEQQAER